MSKSTKMVFRAIGTFSTPLKYAILVCLQVIKKIGRLDFCVWFKRIVNHITSWSDIFIPVYLLIERLSRGLLLSTMDSSLRSAKLR